MWVYIFSVFDSQLEIDEALRSVKVKFERDRSLLTEENRKLTSETDRVGGNKGFVTKTIGPKRFLVRSEP